MFTVYILYSEKVDIYYIGSTGNLEDRLRNIIQDEVLLPNEGFPGF